MKLEQLLEVAKECRRRLTEAENAIKPLAKRLEAMTATDRLSPEAQKAATDRKTLRQTQFTLSKELEIYTAGLKAYGISLGE